MARRNLSPVPLRRCVGCMESKEKEKLIRIVCEEGHLIQDSEGRLDGRGAYLCRGSGNCISEECLEKAIKKKSFQRTFKTGIDSESLELLRKISREVM